MTVYKDIPGYEGFYQAGDDGTIRSVDRNVNQRSGRFQLKKGKVLSLCADRVGYLKCALSKDNKLRAHIVHRLVAATFLSNPKGLPEVNHKDGNKSNNCIDNLEWCDRQHNIQHAYDTNLIPKFYGDQHARKAIKTNQYNRIIQLRQEGHRVTSIARMYNCSIDSIYRALKASKL